MFKQRRAQYVDKCGVWVHVGRPTLLNLASLAGSGEEVRLAQNFFTRVREAKECEFEVGYDFVMY
jgi:hypothetical protein